MDVFFAVPVAVSEKVYKNTTTINHKNSAGVVLSKEGLGSLVFVGVTALEVYGIYKLSSKIVSGAKWTLDKGKVGVSWIGNKVKGTWNARKK